MPNAVVNDVDLYYERWGEGPRLLFLNGSGATIAKRIVQNPPHEMPTKCAFGSFSPSMTSTSHSPYELTFTDGRASADLTD